MIQIYTVNPTSTPGIDRLQLCEPCPASGKRLWMTCSVDKCDPPNFWCGKALGWQPEFGAVSYLRGEGGESWEHSSVTCWARF